MSQFGTVFSLPFIAGVVNRVRIRLVTTFKFSNEERFAKIDKIGP